MYSDDNDDEDYAIIVNAEKETCRLSITVKIGGVPTYMIIDTGATLLVDLNGTELSKQK